MVVVILVSLSSNSLPYLFSVVGIGMLKVRLISSILKGRTSRASLLIGMAIVTKAYLCMIWDFSTLANSISNLARYATDATSLYNPLALYPTNPL